jgi:proline iminopeptidase
MKKLFLILLSLISLSSLGQKQNNKEAFKRVNSVDLFYRSMGEGEPIIAVHGGPGLDEGYFHPSLDPLSVKYKLISYDQRGSGRSKAYGYSKVNRGPIC